MISEESLRPKSVHGSTAVTVTSTLGYVRTRTPCKDRSKLNVPSFSAVLPRDRYTYHVR